MKKIVCYMAIWIIFYQFSNLVETWYIFPCFGIHISKEKSGNPAALTATKSRSKYKLEYKKHVFWK
jgi:hypothetical protein